MGKELSPLRVEPGDETGGVVHRADIRPDGTAVQQRRRKTRIWHVQLIALALSDRIFAAADRRAVLDGLAVTRVGLFGRSYRDPRWGERAP